MTTNKQLDHLCTDCDWVDPRFSMDGTYFVCTCPRRGTCSRAGGELRIEDVSDNGRPDLLRIKECVEKSWKDAD